MREPEKLYELQYSSFAIPPSLYSFECYHHLETMRESYAFVIYFVFIDSLYYLIPIAVSSFSFVQFLRELHKSLNFYNNQATTGKNTSKKRKHLWNLSRSVLAVDVVVFWLTLLILVCFTIYWLVVDPDAVFLFETVHYLNTFFVILVSVHFSLRKFGLLAIIFNSVYHRFVGTNTN